MSTAAWLLPEHIADVLPAQGRRLESLRRTLLDRALAYGYELVAPPLLEHLESLLTGTGHALELRTFKLVDQLSGRTLGLRADTTPQAARIDAHLLNREGVTRLCYCGPVLHTRPVGLLGTREPLQFGAELFGHSGLEADLEVQELAIDCVALAGVGSMVVDLADARLLGAVLAGVIIDPARLEDVAQALARKDAAGLAGLARGMPEPAARALQVMVELYGGDEVLERARRELPPRAGIEAALTQLAWLAGHLRSAHPGLEVAFDLSDLSGYTYYSGPRFAVYAAGASDPLARGGRYDEVGAAFGRSRPAAGFSMDLKALADLGPAPQAAAGAVRVPWSEDAALRAEVRRLRDAGETVRAVMPGQTCEMACDRELVEVDGAWTLRPLPHSPD